MRRFVGEADVVRQRVAEVRDRIAQAAIAAGRPADSVELVVATKYVVPEDMQILRDAGIRVVGENRVQDLVAKHERYGDDFIWDFIGHLQSRKTKQLLPIVRLIHSVDSISVVQELHRRTENMVSVMLEVNIGEEASKSGVGLTELHPFLDEAASYDRVTFVGLMCMPPLATLPEDSAVYFARTRELAEELSSAWAGRYTFAQLSMGTSADYEVAVREGATKVRIGTSVLFS